MIHDPNCPCLYNIPTTPQSADCKHYEPVVPYEVGMTYGSELAGDATNCKNCGRTAVEHFTPPTPPTAEQDARAWLRKYWADTRNGTDLDYTCLDQGLQCELLAAYAAHIRQQQKEQDITTMRNTCQYYADTHNGAGQAMTAELLAERIAAAIRSQP